MLAYSLTGRRFLGRVYKNGLTIDHKQRIVHMNLKRFKRLFRRFNSSFDLKIDGKIYWILVQLEEARD